MPLWLRMTLFVIALLAVIGGTSTYVFRRGATVLGLGRRGRMGLAIALVLAPLAIVASRIVERAGAPSVAFALGAIGATVVLGVLISTVLLWAIDLPFGAAGWMRTWRESRRADARLRAPASGERGDATEPGDPTQPGDASEPSDPIEHDTVGHLAGPSAIGRRELIRRTATGAALSVGFGSALYGALFGRHNYEVNVVPVPIPGLSPRLDGYRIAQISDIHFGVYVGEPELASAVSLIGSARPDLIVLTGDLLDHDAAFAPVLGRLVRRLDELPARDGVVVIPGNHDYYAGIDHVLGAARAGGARVLRNAGHLIGDRGGAFALLGVDDVWAPRNGYGPGPDLARAIAMVPSDVPRVLLCHNPELFPEVRGSVALQLSGHTHGGQVNLGIRPADLVLPYVEGLYEEDGARLYVNRGFGTAGPPARVGAPPEITLVVLTAA